MYEKFQLASNRLGGALYIYAPYHGEEVTIEEQLRIDPLIPVSNYELLTIQITDLDSKQEARVKQAFQRHYCLRDIVPKKFWPDRLRLKRKLLIQLTVHSQRYRYQSQPNHTIVLVQEKKPLTDDFGRSFCLVPWKRSRLGGLSASPCRHLVRKFRVPSDDRFSDYDPWNGDTMAALRNSLVQGRNNYCFHGCPHFSTRVPQEMHALFTGDSLIRDNIDLARAEYLEGVSRLHSKPIVLALKMGTACDNQCTFCSIHSTCSPYTLTGHSLKLAHSWFPFARQVVFTGGEPLVYAKHLRRIIGDHVQQEGKEVRINTNGILVREQLDLLRGFSKLVLSVSLNTSCSKTYQYLHGTDSFQKVVEGVRQVKEARQGLKTEIQLKMIIMRSTYRQIRDFTRLAADLGVDSLVFRELRWYERLKIDVAEKLMPGDPARGEALSAIDEASEYLAPLGVKVRPFAFDARADDVT